MRIFGSVARGEERPESDVDVLVDLDPGRTLFDLAALEERLERLVGVPSKSRPRASCATRCAAPRSAMPSASRDCPLSVADDRASAPRTLALRAFERLEHMGAAAHVIAGSVARGRESFDADPALADAVLYQLVVLGEAAKAALQADPSLATRFSTVPWSSMARVRDRAAHHYYKLDRDVVWETAQTAVPAAAVAIQVALRALARENGWTRTSDTEGVE